jgi:hypothetical protein
MLLMGCTAATTAAASAAAAFVCVSQVLFCSVSLLEGSRNVTVKFDLI